ncbi:exocyst complex component 3-like [Anabas testudineus]|uniref:exocyst complex component 3-like n=1 Tax=Anabas testudineus TaxID=64144 RepID=UPI000E463EC4|nr:exocyst complex component 3-like [Anabas testudineus]
MGKMKDIKEKLLPKSKVWRIESRKPLIEDIKDMDAAYDQDDNGLDSPLDQNSFGIQEQDLKLKEEVWLQELAELLHVVFTEDGIYTLMGPDPKSVVVGLIQKSVSQHFPKPPADLDQNLQQHLMNVQNTVLSELTRLSPYLEPRGLMGCLIDSYHHQTWDHLQRLLQDTSSSQNSFVLIKWGLKTYLSQELLGHPDLKELHPVKEVDLLPFTEWGAQAKEKLLENVQKEVQGYLEKILRREEDQEGCDGDEAVVRLYVDTIACVDAMPTEALKISSELSRNVQEVCFQQLLIFVRRYKDEQTELLVKKAKVDEPELMHFFKTFITCLELKKYVQTKGAGVRTSLCVETVKILDDMEAFTLKLLLDIITNIAESHLKNYFRSESKKFFLIEAVKSNFAKLMNHEDVRERVMNEAYKIIVHTYIKLLIKIKLSKLQKCWSPNVGQTVAQDAEWLHETFSDLAPGVQHWNLMLLKVTEVLDCNDSDALKMTVAGMQKEKLTKSEDLELLHRLLLWKGLTKQQVRETLDAIPDDYQPTPRSGRWYSCFTCW